VPKYKWGDNINIYFKEKELENLDWIHLVQDSPVVGSYEHGNIRDPLNAGNMYIDQLTYVLAFQERICGALSKLVSQSVSQSVS
jgi:hypothetical protein